MSFLFKKPAQPQDPQPANLVPTLINTNGQARAVPVIYGIHKIGATYLCDIWGKQATPIYSSSGGKK